MAELRAAHETDIPRLVEIRGAVRENRLGDLAIGPDDYRRYVDNGCCWVWDENGTIQGFAALDAERATLWALFVVPGGEGRGVGRALLERAVSEAARRGLGQLRLETDRGTRAELFYRAAGWQVVDRDAKGALNMVLAVSAA